jgi:hypothetical protein
LSCCTGTPAFYIAHMARGTMNAPHAVCPASIRLRLCISDCCPGDSVFPASAVSAQSRKTDDFASAELRLCRPAWRTDLRVVAFSAKIAMGKRRTK